MGLKGRMPAPDISLWYELLTPDTLYPNPYLSKKHPFHLSIFPPAAYNLVPKVFTSTLHTVMPLLYEFDLHIPPLFAGQESMPRGAD